MISKKMQKALNEQINREFGAAYHYLAMAAAFETKSLGGFAHWMQAQSREEIEHAMKIYNHINERDGEVVLDAIDKPQVKVTTPKSAFQKALELEQANTKAINELYAMAVKENDYPAQIMLQWFIDEQVEEESSVQEVIDHLDLAQETPSAILILNGRLGQRE